MLRALTGGARSETAATLPAFSEAFKLRRCLVLADSFYEWKKGIARQPHCFEVGTGDLFAFAGLWDRWQTPDGQRIRSFSILTTSPNELNAPNPRPNAGHPGKARL